LKSREVRLGDSLVIAAILELLMLLLGSSWGVSAFILVLLLASLILTVLLALYLRRAGGL